jgi:hypothetical protein
LETWDKELWQMIRIAKATSVNRKLFFFI